MEQPIRKPEEIAELLVKICKENDDRVGQALINALDMQFQERVSSLAALRSLDLFGIEDNELLEMLKAYFKSSVSGNKKVK